MECYHEDGAKNDQKTKERNDDPRDKGWAWVIAIATAYMNFIFSGTIKANGFFYLGWLDLYKESPSTIAWVRTSYGLISTCLAPLAGYLRDRMSFKASRILVFTTGFLLSLSIVVTAWMPNVTTVFIVHSLVGGVTTGLVVTPVLTLLPEYFVKKRALASGISLSGGSLGGLIMPIIINLLDEEYGMRGMLTILGGFFFNILVIAAVMIPLKKTKKADSPVEMKSVNPDGSHINEGFKVEDEDLSQKKQDDDRSHINEGFMDDSDSSPASQDQDDIERMEVTDTNSVVDSDKDSKTHAGSGSDVDSGLSSVETEVNNQAADSPEVVKKNDTSTKDTDDTGDANSQSKSGSDDEETEQDQKEKLESKTDMDCREVQCSPEPSTGDAIDETVNKNASNNNQIDNENHGSKNKKTIAYRIRHNKIVKGLMLYINFLRTPHLMSLILTFLCQSCAYFTQFFVLVPFTTELGESTATASTILAIISSIELFARFFTGYLGDKLKRNKYLILFVSFPLSFLIGILLVAFPSKTLLYVYAPIFGLFGSQATTLCIPMTTELVPPKDLGKAAGIFPVVVGIGSAIGNQVATVVFEQTNSYRYSMLFCVCMYLVSLVFLCVYAFGIWRSRKSQKMIKVIV